MLLLAIAWQSVTGGSNGLPGVPGVSPSSARRCRAGCRCSCSSGASSAVGAYLLWRVTRGLLRRAYTVCASTTMPPCRSGIDTVAAFQRVPALRGLRRASPGRCTRTPSASFRRRCWSFRSWWRALHRGGRRPHPRRGRHPRRVPLVQPSRMVPRPGEVLPHRLRRGAAGDDHRRARRADRRDGQAARALVSRAAGAAARADPAAGATRCRVRGPARCCRSSRVSLRVRRAQGAGQGGDRARAGRDLRPHRTQRLRQDHAASTRHRHVSRGFGRDERSPAGCAACTPARGCLAPGIARTFQNINLVDEHERARQRGRRACGHRARRVGARRCSAPRTTPAGDAPARYAMHLLAAISAWRTSRCSPAAGWRTA